MADDASTSLQDFLGGVMAVGNTVTAEAQNYRTVIDTVTGGTPLSRPITGYTPPNQPLNDTAAPSEKGKSVLPFTLPAWAWWLGGGTLVLALGLLGYKAVSK